MLTLADACQQQPDSIATAWCILAICVGLALVIAAYGLAAYLIGKNQ